MNLLYVYLFIGETAFNSLFIAGFEVDGKLPIIASELSNSKRAEYDLH